MKDLNYYDTFIEVAEDCPADVAEVPQPRGERKTIPVLQYELIANHPYTYTQEDILFEVHATRKDIPQSERTAARKEYFSKGRPCLRTSALCKRYGWGIHNDAEGKVALYAVESEAYQELANDERLAHVKAMRSSKA